MIFSQQNILKPINQNILRQRNKTMEDNQSNNQEPYEPENNEDVNVTEAKLWSKVTNYAQRAGVKLIYSVLLMWYAYERKDTPPWAKRIILGALAYFISPIDFIPDLTPFLGFTDDLGILGMGLVAIAAYINDDVRKNARERLSKWFKNYKESDLREVDDKL
jgi:uncharacterized membrane protein YkvA (DUF1232 family)